MRRLLSVFVFSALVFAADANNNPVGSSLPKWRAAVSRVRAGLGDAKILVVGDSTAAGVGGSSDTTVPAYKSWPWQMATMLNRDISTAPGLAVGPSHLFKVADDRWSLGPGWETFASGFASSSGLCGTGAGKLVFTPGGDVTYDSFDVYYTRYPGLAPLSVTATGGKTRTLITGSGALDIQVATVTAAKAGKDNAVTFSSSGKSCVLGVEPWLSTEKRIRVANAGVSSAATSHWANAANFNGLHSIKKYAPDLTIISLGINDANAPNGPVPIMVFRENLEKIIDAAQISGDVLLLTIPPSAENLLVAERQYSIAYSSLSMLRKIETVDVWARWKGAYQPSLMKDRVHPNDSGYSDIASAVADFLKTH